MTTYLYALFPTIRSWTRRNRHLASLSTTSASTDLDLSVWISPESNPYRRRASKRNSQFMRRGNQRNGRLLCVMALKPSTFPLKTSL